MSKTLRSLADRESALALMFMAPSVIYILALVAFPFGLAVLFAFSDVTAGDPSFDFVGLANFDRVFADPVFWTALGNTLRFTVISVAIIIVLGKVLANILLANFKGKWIIRFMVLLPWTTPVSLSAMDWRLLFDNVYSPINWSLRHLGLIDSPIYFVADPDYALWSVIIVHVWRLVPLAAVITMAGMLSIPAEVNEAAQVDGAGFWRRMFEITIPLVMPVIGVAALFAAIFTFTDMAVVRIVTRGDPNNATQVLSSWAYARGIEGGDLGQGAGVALFLFPLLLAAAIGILQAVRRSEIR